MQQFAWAQQQQQGILGRGWARKETIVFEYANMPLHGDGALRIDPNHKFDDRKFDDRHGEEHGTTCDNE